MNEEELKLLDKIKELPKELNIEIRGLILSEVCLREENQQLKRQLERSEKARKEAIEYVKKRNFDRAEILVDMECEYYYDDDFKDCLLYILEKE